MSKWLCDFCREEFDSELKALEHENTCSKEIGLAKEEEKKATKKREIQEKKEKEQKAAKKREKERLARYEEERKLKEEIKKEENKLLEEKRQREREAKLLLQNKILEEEKELELFTYHSMKSDTRFPYLNIYITLLKIFAALALAIGIILSLISADEGFGTFGLFFVVFSLFMALGFLMASEIIRLLLDFHNNNHTNTKVKIETLKVLEKISKKLDK